jgi:(R,R)-butanediol dehydrogenase / meso-butanediol dehydrogenase / diacetyl reductase
VLAATYPSPHTIALVEHPIPEPGPGQVRLRVRACGFCGSDLHLLEQPAAFMPPGTAAGHEIAGAVDALGEGVEGWRTGAAAVVEPLVSCGECRFCREGRDSICPQISLYGVAHHGGFAEYVVVDAKRLWPVDASIGWDVAALAEPVAVVVHGLRIGGFRPEEPLLVLGAGTIGLLTTAVARAWGATDIALTARHPHQQEIGRELGATEILTGRATDAAALAERGAPLVVETVGGSADTLLAASAGVGRGGRITVLGLFLEPRPIEPLGLFFKEGSIHFANCYQRKPGEEDFVAAVRLLERHGQGWRRLLTHQVPLAEAPRAYELARDKSSRSVKVTLIP